MATIEIMAIRHADKPSDDEAIPEIANRILGQQPTCPQKWPSSRNNR